MPDSSAERTNLLAAGLNARVGRTLLSDAFEVVSVKSTSKTWDRAWPKLVEGSVRPNRSE
jgi:hypothetical protein